MVVEYKYVICGLILLGVFQKLEAGIKNKVSQLESKVALLESIVKLLQSSIQNPCLSNCIGLKGDMGPSGSRGRRGAKGNLGPTGQRGVPGLKGDNGPKGDTGPMGPHGRNGTKGEKGDSGVFNHRTNCCDGSTCPACPSGFVYYSNSCYKFSYDGLGKTTWYGAEAVCDDLNAHLLAIETEQELGFIVDKVTADGKGSDEARAIFIGGHRSNGTWEWTGGKTMCSKPMVYTSWGPNMPYDYIRLACTALDVYDRQWSNALCGYASRAYICEIDL